MESYILDEDLEISYDQGFTVLLASSLGVYSLTNPSENILSLAPYFLSGFILIISYFLYLKRAKFSWSSPFTPFWFAGFILFLNGVNITNDSTSFLYFIGVGVLPILITVLFFISMTRDKPVLRTSGWFLR